MTISLILRLGIWSCSHGTYYSPKNYRTHTSAIITLKICKVALKSETFSSLGPHGIQTCDLLQSSQVLLTTGPHDNEETYAYSLTVKHINVSLKI